MLWQKKRKKVEKSRLKINDIKMKEEMKNIEIEENIEVEEIMIRITIS